MNLKENLKIIFKREKNKLIKLTLCKGLTTSLRILNPLIIGVYIDVLITSKNLNLVYKFIGIFLIISIISLYLNYIISISLSKLRLKLSNNLLIITIEHLNKCKISHIKTYNSSYLTQRITQDSNQVIEFLLNNITMFFIQMFILIIESIIIIKINITFFILVIVIGVVNLLIYINNKNKLYKEKLRIIEAQNNYFSTIHEDIDNIYFIKVHAIYKEIKTRVSEKFNTYFDTFNSFVKFQSKYELTQSVPSGMINLTILLYGGIGIINNKFSIGQFTVLNSYANMILSSVTFFIQFSTIYQGFKTAYTRLEEIFEIGLEQNSCEDLDDIKHIKMVDVSLTYSDKLILNNINISFEKGNIYNIVGTNGSGKTSLLNILLNIEQNYNGQIYYNGVDVKKLNCYKLRKEKISFVEQDTTILNDFLYKNLILLNDKNYCTLFDKNLNENLVNLLLSVKKLESNKFISKSTLSGGEQKKISILRSTLKNSNLIILDEPTNALDKQSIYYLKNYLNDIKSQKIIIIVSHSPTLDDIIDYTINLSLLNSKVI